MHSLDLGLNEGCVGFNKNLYFNIIYDHVLVLSGEKEKFYVAQSINRELNTDGTLEKLFLEISKSFMKKCERLFEL